jgi:hypothetical protein
MSPALLPQLLHLAPSANSARPARREHASNSDFAQAPPFLKPQGRSRGQNPNKWISKRDAADTFCHFRDTFCRACDTFCRARDTFCHARDTFCRARDTFCRARDTFCRARDTFCRARDTFCHSRDTFCRARDTFCRACDTFCRACDTFCRARDTFCRACGTLQGAAVRQTRLWAPASPHPNPRGDAASCDRRARYHHRRHCERGGNRLERFASGLQSKPDGTGRVIPPASCTCGGRFAQTARIISPLAAIICRHLSETTEDRIREVPSLSLWSRYCRCFLRTPLDGE